MAETSSTAGQASQAPAVYAIPSTSAADKGPEKVAPETLSPAEQAEYKFDKNLSVLAFVLRCTISGVLAYALTHGAHQKSAVWAAMAAVHVAREPLTKTHKETFQRVWGTVVGSAVGLGVIALSYVVPMDMLVQIALAISITSLISAYNPLLHISMWICLAVMLKSPGDMTPFEVGVSRTLAVIFGALVAVVVHKITVEVVRYIRNKRGVKVAQDIVAED